ncbi:hypothetical protein B0H13DRAFT_2269527 [Mycena leptocephala]|nr:hypothetical protein B0H13DRAFT_2269527 [Mycena leptocephala]
MITISAHDKNKTKKTNGPRDYCNPTATASRGCSWIPPRKYDSELIATRRATTPSLGNLYTRRRPVAVQCLQTAWTPNTGTPSRAFDMDDVPVEVDGQPSSRRRRRVTRQLTHQDASRVVLFCGADQPRNYADFDARRPWRVQMLPEDVDVPEPSPQRSNGCGAKVHASAMPKPTLWLGAQSSGTAAVVSLEQQYVPEHLKLTMDSKTEVCGCTRSPVGCAVCGNPLGALTVFCGNHTSTLSESSQTAAMYKFAPSAVSPPLPVITARRPPLSSAAYPTSQPPIDFDSDPDEGNLWVRPPHRVILDVLNAAEAATRDNDLVDATARTPVAPDANASNAATTRVRRVGLASHLGQRFQREGDGTEIGPTESNIPPPGTSSRGPAISPPYQSRAFRRWGDIRARRLRPAAEEETP